MIHINRHIIPKTFSIAISGGIDSLACAHLLKTLGYDFKAIHFNHNQREQNQKMVDVCQKFCDDFKIDLTIGKCEVKFNNNIEDNLRNERLKFFERIGGHIVMAHHLGDVTEQYIMNCFKGCPEHFPILPVVHFPQFVLVRPFLQNKKQKFVEWVNGKNLTQYLEVDETNTDSKYERNWIRNEIIPKIEERRGLEKVVLKKFF